MNSVSWFLYFADILGGVSTLILITGVVVVMASTLTTALSFVYEFVETKKSNGPEHWNYEYVKTAMRPMEAGRPYGIAGLTIGLILTFVSVLIPSKQTLYMIAASQIGEQIIQLEEVQSVGGEIGGLATDTIELLRQRINEELKPAKEAEE